jgi:hypothetical protein
MRLELERPVHCADGGAGTLADVVVDPVQRRVTHLVVRAPEPDLTARLVPFQLVTASDDSARELCLSCTAAELAKLDPVREYAYLPLDELPEGSQDWDVGVEDVMVVPNYEAAELGVYAAEVDPNVGVTYDRVPKGEVEIRRTSGVQSADGHHLGDMVAFLVDAGAITDVVLASGHLWRTRNVTVPIGAVATIETNAITLGLSKDEVGKLAGARAQRWRFL